MKIQQQSPDKQCFVTIPKALLNAKGWKKGDTVQFKLNNQGQLILSKT